MTQQLAIRLAEMVPGQLDTAEKLVALLRDGGPWALLALALLAIVWLAKAYKDARDERDAAVSNLNDKLTGLLKDVVSTAEQQKAANEKICDILERLERRLEDAPRRE